MKMCPVGALFALVVLFPAWDDGDAPESLSGEKVEVYKTIGEVALKIHVFFPEGHTSASEAPAIVFFHGGGWAGGNPRQFSGQCRFLNGKGMVAASAEYRLTKKHGTTVFECVKDAKSAVRWMREHAAELGVDPALVCAGGASAGGHVAACTGTVPGVEEEGEKVAVSSVPAAMVLFNPVVDTGEKGFGKRMIGERWKEISPVDHVRKGVPPTIIFHGTADKAVPFENVERFTAKMKAAKNECRLVSFEGRGHRFFNRGMTPGEDKDADYDKTLEETAAFLTRLEILKKSGEEDGEGDDKEDPGKDEERGSGSGKSP